MSEAGHFDLATQIDRGKY